MSSIYSGATTHVTDPFSFSMPRQRRICSPGATYDDHGFRHLRYDRRCARPAPPPSLSAPQQDRPSRLRVAPRTARGFERCCRPTQISGTARGFERCSRPRPASENRPRPQRTGAPDRVQTAFEVHSMGRRNAATSPRSAFTASRLPLCPEPATRNTFATGPAFNNSQARPSTRRYSVDAAFQQHPPRTLSDPCPFVRTFIGRQIHKSCSCKGLRLRTKRPTRCPPPKIVLFGAR